MNLDMPALAVASHMHSTYQGGAGGGLNFIAKAYSPTPDEKREWLRPLDMPLTPTTVSQKESKPMAAATPACRLVRVIVVDPHESVPMANRVLYMGSEKMTDSTDEELFFEIAAELGEKLKSHNEQRLTWTEKKNAADPEKAKKLEAARIRDLKMTVVNIATF